MYFKYCDNREDSTKQPKSPLTGTHGRIAHSSKFSHLVNCTVTTRPRCQHFKLLNISSSQIIGLQHVGKSTTHFKDLNLKLRVQISKRPINGF